MAAKKDRVLISGIYLVAFILLFLGGMLFFEFYSGRNLGVEFGYYGRLNRFQHAIEKMPNVEIVDVFLHKDISLEDFEFNLLVNHQEKVSVWIGETDPIRDERDKDKIRDYISAKIAEETKIPNESRWRLSQ